MREAQEKRQNEMMSVFNVGSSWLHIKNLIAAVRTPSAKPTWGGPSRQGAKMIKPLEQQMPEGVPLTPQTAKLFRALSARANYLSQGRPGGGFSPKELCREFAVPTISRYDRLKRLVRYLRLVPRLVYILQLASSVCAHGRSRRHRLRGMRCNPTEHQWRSGDAWRTLRQTWGLNPDDSVPLKRRGGIARHQQGRHNFVGCASGGSRPRDPSWHCHAHRRERCTWRSAAPRPWEDSTS